MEIHDYLSQAETFSENLLISYGYPNSPIIDQWTEANASFEITLKRLQQANSCLLELETLLGDILAEDEVEKLEKFQSLIGKAKDRLDPFYGNTERLLTDLIVYGGSLNSKIQSENILDNRKNWWNLFVGETHRVQYLLVSTLTTRDLSRAKQRVLEALELVVNMLDEEIEKFGEPSDFYPTIAELKEKLIALDVDILVFDGKS